MKIQLTNKADTISLSAESGKVLHIKSKHLLTIDRTSGEIVIIGDDFEITERK